MLYARPMAKKQNPTLARSTAYKRLAAKAHHAGQYKQSEHYHRLGEKFYREYLRNKEATERFFGKGKS